MGPRRLYGIGEWIAWALAGVFVLQVLSGQIDSPLTEKLIAGGVIVAFALGFGLARRVIARDQRLAEDAGEQPAGWLSPPRSGPGPGPAPE